MSTLTNAIPYSIGSPSHSDQTRKKIKRCPNWKGGRNAVTVDDMMVYIENPIDSKKKKKKKKTQLNQKNGFGKKVGYKVNIKKSKAFLYTNNGISETEIREKPCWCSSVD